MDIHDARVDSLLDEIINTELCEVPIDKPWSVEEFEKRTTVSLIKLLILIKNGFDLLTTI